MNRFNDPPGIPLPLYPVETEVEETGAELVVGPSVDPDLDQVSYEFEVFMDAGMTMSLASGKSDETAWRIPGSLDPGGRYYWRARAVDEHGEEGTWSKGVWFAIAPKEGTPGVPRVNSPIDGGTVLSLRPALSVNNAEHGREYVFEIYSDATLKHLIDTGTEPQGSLITSWTLETYLKDRETYYWRSRALNGELIGSWMSTASFVVSLEEVETDVSVEARTEVLPSGTEEVNIEVVKSTSPIKGARITIPPGALNESCCISMGIVKNPPAFPGNIKVVGKVIDLGPDGTVFNKPVTITIPLTAADLEEAGTDDLDEMKVFTFNITLLAWEEIPVESVDREKLLIVFRVNHFSTYTIGRDTLGAERESSHEPGGGGGCFLSGAGVRETEDRTFKKGIYLIPVLLLFLASGLWFLLRKRRKKGTWPLLFLLLFLFVSSPESWATTATISISGSEGSITLNASASFSSYEDENSGNLFVYHFSTLIQVVPGEGSASWSTTLDGGALPQGEHAFSAVAVDSRGTSHSASATVDIDNMPVVSVSDPGEVEGEFDIEGTASFKEHLGGEEGTVHIALDTTDYRFWFTKGYEGTSVHWIYSEITGSKLDAGKLANGEHRVYVYAKAANGATTENVEGPFTIDNTPLVTVESPGLVRGEFDIGGTATFKEHAGGDEGMVYVALDTTDYRYWFAKSYEGTEVQWTYSEIVGSKLDAGKLANGEHRVYVYARAANEATTENVEGPFQVDNTPQVSISTIGAVEGEFDIQGSATFKEHAGGDEGWVYVALDTTDYRYWFAKSYEGTEVQWTYSEIVGNTLDAGELLNGEHRIYAYAKAANEAVSETVMETFDVDNTPTVTVVSPGRRQGLIDIVGTVVFKEHAGGGEGSVHIFLDNHYYDCYQIATGGFEGTHINWSYSEINGHMFDLAGVTPGPHKIYVYAKSHNGTYSSLVEADLYVLGGEDLDPGKNQGAGAGPCENRPDAGDPINFATGNVYQRETDFTVRGPGIPLVFRRHYNSTRDFDGTLGQGWSHTWSDSVTSQGDSLLLTRADGMTVHFDRAGENLYVSEVDRFLTMEKTGTGYVLTGPDGRRRDFDTEGRLLQVSDRNGNSQALSYEGGRVSAVEDNFARRVEFSYNGDLRLSTLSGPAGEFVYNYDGAGNLTDVIFPDGKARSYVYGDPGDPHNLTGVINEKGVQYGTYAYDGQGRGISFSFPDGREKVEITYGPGNQRVLKDSLGRVRTYDLHVAHGIGRVKSVSGKGCRNCPSSDGSDYVLDDRLQIGTKTHASGSISKFTHDARGNVLTETEAFGTEHERTVTYSYHDQYDLVTSIRKESLSGEGRESSAVFEYDEKGNLLQMTETGFSGEDAISLSVSYSCDALGRMTKIDGPRKDVEDLTTMTYYPNTGDQGHNRGMLKTVRNPLGHEVTFSQYNGFGHPERVTDANGVVTVYSYDLRGRMLTKTVEGRVTLYTYDDAGNLVAITDPEGGVISFTYSDANDLLRIEDQTGNFIEYFYDTEGNRVREENRDPEGNLKRYVEYEYNDQDLIERVIHPGGAPREMEYDDSGDMVSLIDENGKETVYEYDILRRLSRVTQPGNTITRFAYNDRDQLATLRDAKDNSTNYSYDDFGRVISTDSPDTNTTSCGYDGAGNLTSVTDARGITVNYEYDALNRPVASRFPDSNQDVLNVYDEGENGKGHITSMIDSAGRTEYGYDKTGRLIEEIRTMEGVTYPTRYGYDDNGNLVSMIYPNGLSVVYDRDEAGRVSTTRAGGEILTKGLSHLPFGPVSSMTFGDDLLSLSRTHDERYQVESISAGSLMDYQYAYDHAGNITSISGVTDPMPSGETDTYEYEGNRLLRGETPDTVAYEHDAHGNMISDGTRTFEYNQNNRLKRVSEGGEVLGEYSYDGLGRRVMKVASGTTTCFHYDPTGNLIAETSGEGTPQRDYIYQDGERVAMKVYGDGDGIYYFLNDHLDTPHIIIDHTGEIVWQAAYLPFGQARIIKETVSNNLRFPGQYYDQETGLHYNYFRYYDPRTGRYLTPDPSHSVQPRGGSIPYLIPFILNTPIELNNYHYAQSNPINFMDLKGLRKSIPKVPIYKLACVTGAMAKFVYCIHKCKSEYQCNKELITACNNDCYDTFEFTVEVVCGVKMEGPRPVYPAELGHQHGGGGAGGQF